MYLVSTSVLMPMFLSEWRPGSGTQSHL